jgi:hypothetical protein
MLVVAIVEVSVWSDVGSSDLASVSHKGFSRSDDLGFIDFLVLARYGWISLIGLPAHKIRAMIGNATVQNFPALLEAVCVAPNPHDTHSFSSTGSPGAVAASLQYSSDR